MNVLRQLIEFITAPFRLLLAVPIALFSAPRRLVGMSLPARIAVLSAIFLLIISIMEKVLYFWFTKKAEWGHKLVYFPLELLLCFAIPWTIYQALRLWLRGHVSRYPDIDLAWKQGMAAMEKRGIDISSLPVFLVVGARNLPQVKSLFRASGLAMSMNETPEGPAALHWYVDERGIFLVCTNASQLGKLSHLVDIAPTAAKDSPLGPASNASNLRGTIVAGNIASLHQSADFSAPSPPQSRQAFNIRGTMEPISASPSATMTGPVVSGGSRFLDKSEADEQSGRLEYICDLLRRSREPVCPINGVLTLLQFDVMQRGDTQCVEVRNAAQADMRVIRETTQIRCPVIALVSGIDTEAGFLELMRRVGIDPPKSNRFGKSYGVWNPPMPEQLEAVAYHACGAFEDTVYQIFREREAFNKPGNSKLYSILCKTRGDFKKRLADILVNAFSTNVQKNRHSEPEPLLFSGCYFAATGETEDRQGFVRSVFDKLMQEESELQWTSEALAQDERCRLLATLGMMASAVFAIAIVGIFVWSSFWS